MKEIEIEIEHDFLGVYILNQPQENLFALEKNESILKCGTWILSMGTIFFSLSQSVLASEFKQKVRNSGKEFFSGKEILLEPVKKVGKTRVKTVVHMMPDMTYQALNKFLIQNALLTAHLDLFKIQKKKFKEELAKEVQNQSFHRLWFQSNSIPDAYTRIQEAQTISLQKNL